MVNLMKFSEVGITSAAFVVEVGGCVLCFTRFERTRLEVGVVYAFGLFLAPC